VSEALTLRQLAPGPLHFVVDGALDLLVHVVFVAEALGHRLHPGLAGSVFPQSYNTIAPLRRR
jgi:hypothetical protein